MNKNSGAENPQEADYGKKLSSQQINHACEMLMFPFSDSLSEADKACVENILSMHKAEEAPTIENLVLDFVGAAKNCLSAKWCCYFHTFKVLQVIYKRALDSDFHSNECKEKSELGIQLYECLCTSFKEAM